jgi:hypothetical protein
MTHFLLTGAGFSRNWGGWLANEAFEYLLGVPTLDDFTRNILWRNKLQGDGFEGALAVLQATYANGKSAESHQRLNAMNDALIAMFTEMQSAYAEQNLSGGELRLQRFLSRFDCIFTLNQDTFLETHYAGAVRWSERWQGSYLPKMRFAGDPDIPERYRSFDFMTPDENATPQELLQPIYKLHGSYNWQAQADGARLLVMGGNKTATIQSLPILAEYQRVFQDTLCQPTSRLMVIGYSFGDVHINKVIQTAAQQGLKVFIIDPMGVDVLDKRNPKAQIPEPVPDFLETMMTSIVGASRRPLTEIIQGHQGEHAKVIKFFDGQETIQR